MTKVCTKCKVEKSLSEFHKSKRDGYRSQCKPCNSEKITRTSDILGYTPLELKKHLEYLFKDGMNWENYGEWHVDHIKPICKFDNSELPSVVNALENLQPLWAKDNLIKGGKYE